MSRSYRILSALLLVAVLAACNPAPRTNAAKGSSVAPKAETSGVTAEKKSMDIGDVESVLHIVATLAARSAAPNIKVEEMKDSRNHLDLTTLTIGPPDPKEVYVSFRVEASKPLTEGPVALRAKILRDNQEIGSFATLLGADAVNQPYEQAVNVLAGLEAVPDTFLVHVQAEVILLPAGTDPATVDVRTVSGTPDSTGAVLSNPVRVNFKRPAGGSS